MATRLSEAYWRNKTLTPEQLREEFRAKRRAKHPKLPAEERIRRQQEGRRLRREYDIAMAAMEQEIEHGD